MRAVNIYGPPPTAPDEPRPSGTAATGTSGGGGSSNGRIVAAVAGVGLLATIIGVALSGSKNTGMRGGKKNCDCGR